MGIFGKNDKTQADPASGVTQPTGQAAGVGSTPTQTGVEPNTAPMDDTAQQTPPASVPTPTVEPQEPPVSAPTSVGLGEEPATPAQPQAQGEVGEPASSSTTTQAPAGVSQTPDDSELPTSPLGGTPTATTPQEEEESGSGSAGGTLGGL